MADFGIRCFWTTSNQKMYCTVEYLFGCIMCLALSSGLIMNPSRYRNQISNMISLTYKVLQCDPHLGKKFAIGLLM